MRESVQNLVLNLTLGPAPELLGDFKKWMSNLELSDSAFSSYKTGLQQLVA